VIHTDLLLIVDILKEYRRLDDTIIMRLNRANALARDADRERQGAGPDNSQNQACIVVWRELVGKYNTASVSDVCVFIPSRELEAPHTARKLLRIGS
jgi:hypothetical protein